MLIFFTIGLAAISELSSPSDSGGDYFTGTAVVQTNNAIVVAITFGPEDDPLETAISVALTGTHLASLSTADVAYTATVLATRTPPPPTNMPTYIPTRVLAYWTATAAVGLTAELQSMIDDARLENVTLSASAFGENCYTYFTNEVEYFAAMQTDFNVTAQVDNLGDETVLGDLAAHILTILTDIPSDKKPGPMPGQITLTFTQDNKQRVLTVTIQQSQEMVEQGLSGAALWTALNEAR